MNRNLSSQLFCQLIGHENSQILGVCLYQEYQQRRAWCVGCKFHLHANHQQELKTFEEFRNWNNQNNNSDELKELLSRAQSIVKLLNQLIQNKEEAQQKFNFYQMNYTDLENSVNKLVRVYESQRKVIKFLQQKLSPDNIKTFQKLIQPGLEFSSRKVYSVTQLPSPEPSLNKLQIQIKQLTQPAYLTKQQNEPKKDDVSNMMQNSFIQNPIQRQNYNIEKQNSQRSSTSNQRQKSYSPYESRNQNYCKPRKIFFLF